MGVNNQYQNLSEYPNNLWNPNPHPKASWTTWKENREMTPLKLVCWTSREEPRQGKRMFGMMTCVNWSNSTYEVSPRIVQEGPLTYCNIPAMVLSSKKKQNIYWAWSKLKMRVLRWISSKTRNWVCISLVSSSAPICTYAPCHPYNMERIWTHSQYKKKFIHKTLAVPILGEKWKN